MPDEQRPRVVIVGAGFGGLEAAKKLACENVDLTILDRANYHLFQPLLYQVATAALSPADIAAPIRAILHDCKNVEVMLAEVQSVDVNNRIVQTGDLRIAYDYLILATGSRHSYFGHPEWERLAPGLKSLEDAVEIRRRILMAFEYAEKMYAEKMGDTAVTTAAKQEVPTFGRRRLSPGAYELDLSTVINAPMKVNPYRRRRLPFAVPPRARSMISRTRADRPLRWAAAARWICS